MPEPFLRWAGSKRKLLPTLSEYWDADSSRYVEPFAGSACLFFHLSPKKAILGDINSELVLTFTQVRDNLPAVLEQLGRLKKGKRQYLSLRTTLPESLSPPDRAARFIFLNRYCFNGLFRTNEAGLFNVPYSGSRTGPIPPDETFHACSALLQSAELCASPFDVTLRKARRGDFVYLDPPYRVAAKRVFRQYDAMTFSKDQVDLLRAWLIRLTSKSVRFVLSYAESAEGRFLAQGFRLRRVAVRRNIAGFAAQRRRAYELLISN